MQLQVFRCKYKFKSALNLYSSNNMRVLCRNVEYFKSCSCLNFFAKPYHNISSQKYILLCLIVYCLHVQLVYRLFVLPHYCSPVADLSILHSRRQKYEQPDNNVKADSVQTKVYICATMWHENRTEMKQFLKTLFRLEILSIVHQNWKQKTHYVTI